MTEQAPQQSLLALWSRFAGWPGGKWLFSRLVCWHAPYFLSIRPRFVELCPGHCEVRMAKRRAVLNHIGSVHAIAMCNLAELAAGTLTEVTIPATLRWIPKGMSVEYLKKADTDLRASARLDPRPYAAVAEMVPVIVTVSDAQGQNVMRANISMWISPRPTRES